MVLRSSGDIMAKVDAPKPDAIQWLLLRAKSREGAGTLSAAAYIRRTVTRAGVAPRTGGDANHLSEQARIRYSAFFGGGKK